MVTRAIELALRAHENKTRIGTDIPYAVHPIEVGIILSRNKMEEETIIAGIIHDAVEQEYLSLEEVEGIFGPKVKRIVEKVYIADKYQDGEDYTARKKRTLDYLREEASPEFKFVTCADRLSNVKMMQDEYKVIGDKVWERYKEGYEKRKWYYQSLVVSLTQISSYDMYKEFVKRIEELFGPVSASVFINDDLQTIEDRFDMDVAEQSTWLIEHMVGFLGQIIEEFEIEKDANIKEDLRKAMIKTLDMYHKQNNSEEFSIPHDDWVNCIKIFYILRRFFKFNNTWIREHIGINYLAWYKLYDTEFKLKIK